MKKPIKILTYDIEAKDWNKFLIGCVYDGINRYYAYNTSELIDIFEFLSSYYKSYKTVFYAHYGGKYDIKLIFDELINRYDNDFLIINGGLTVVKNKFFELRDSYNILPYSLKVLSKEFGVTNKLDVDRENISSLSNTMLREYVFVDCKALYEVLHKAKEYFGIKEYDKVTIASQSFSEWKKTVENYRYYFINKIHDSFIRKAYYGGRTEVFKRHGYNLKYYDINSMYPYVMSKYPYPMGNPVLTKDYKKGLLGVYEVKVKTPDNIGIPLLPYRHNGKLVFPIGEFRGVYTSVELEKAISLGYDIKVINGLYWERSGNPFVNYITKWHGIKEEASKKGDKGLKLIAKLYLNTLYGKFGQRRVFDRVIHNPSIKYLSKGLIPLSDDYSLFSYKEEVKSNYTGVHIACFVTSYARLELYKALSNSVNVYYCDTDSVVCEYLGASLRVNDGLGSWELEHIVKEGVFIAPKVYCLVCDDGYVNKAKGFMNSFSYDDYKRLLNNDFDVFKGEKRVIVGFLEALRRGLSVDDVIIRKRSFKGVFDKRVLCVDNVSTKPLMFYNIEKII